MSQETESRAKGRGRGRGKGGDCDMADRNEVVSLGGFAILLMGSLKWGKFQE